MKLLHYETRGTGPAILLLHGFTGSGADWLPLLPNLSENYRYIIPDLRGHGRSLNPSDSYTHRQSALDVFELLDELGVRTVKACGMSGGAMALLHMATQQPERMDAMVLVSPTTHYPEQARQVMGLTRAENQSKAAWASMREKHKYGDDQIIKLWNQARAFKDDTTDMAFDSSDLGGIRAKTLIVHGDRDPLFLVDIPVSMFNAIPDAGLWIIPDGEHIPVFGDFMEIFFKKVSEFFNRPGTDG